MTTLKPTAVASGSELIAKGGRLRNLFPQTSIARPEWGKTA